MNDFTAQYHERRNSVAKHGGSASIQAQRRAAQAVPPVAAEEDGPWNDFAAADDGPWNDFGPAPSKPLSPDERQAAYGLNVWNNALMGFGDEALSGLSAAGELVKSGGDTKRAGDVYTSEVAKARDLAKRYEEQEPWDSWGNIASTGAGLVAGGPAFLKGYKVMQGAGRALTGGKAATTLGRIGQEALALGGTGAAASEVQQAGNAEGGVNDRLNAIGAGGLMVPAVGAIGAVAAGGLGSGGVRLAQRGGQMLRSAENKAARYIAEKLLQAGQTTDELAAAHAKAAQTGKPVTLADVGPQGVKDAAGAAGRTPGPGRETAQATILPRQEAQVARVSGDVGEAVGGDPGTFTQTAEAISAKRAEQAKPLYERAFSGNKPVTSPKIVEITNRPSGKAALQRGLKIAQDEGIPESELVIKDDAGNVIGYSAKALHYTKMALDDMIESAQRTGDNAAARAFSIMKNELLGEMDAQIPGYAKAREVFAGHSANKRALEMGRAAHNAHPDQIRSEMEGLSPGEREMYRRGFAQRVIEEVERSPDQGNAARRIFGNTVKRERMRAVLGDDQFGALAEKLGVEEQMYGTYKRTNVGSETAERQAAQNDIDEFLVGQTPDMAQGFTQSVMSGSVVPLLHRIGMGGVANLLRGISQKARGQIAKMLFSHDPREVKAALNAISKEYAAAKRFQAAQEAAMAASAGNEKGREAGAVTAAGAYTYSPVKPF